MDKNEMNPSSFVLSSVLTGYPDANFRGKVAALLESDNLILPLKLKEMIQNVVREDSNIDDLRSEYIAIFDHAKSLNPLYETEYGRERVMFKANDLADISGFYKAFGFELDQEAGHEMVDHLSVELEFYSLMQMKYLFLSEKEDQQGQEIVLDGMKKFLNSHLGRFIPALLERDGVRNSEFYSVVIDWVNTLVIDECRRLSVEPELVHWFASQNEKDEITCGAVAGLTK